MLKFDKLKLITHINYISYINLTKFNTIIKDGVVTAYQYQQTSPLSALYREGHCG